VERRRTVDSDEDACQRLLSAAFSGSDNAKFRQVFLRAKALVTTSASLHKRKFEEERFSQN